METFETISFPSGGSVRIHHLVSRDDSDFESLLSVARLFAEKGSQVMIGYTTTDSKRAFSNMLNRGLKQSDRLIIINPNLTERYMRRSILGRIANGANITEVWILNPSGSMNQLYKKQRIDAKSTLCNQRIGSH